jgi:hypothetical protein
VNLNPHPLKTKRVRHPKAGLAEGDDELVEGEGFFGVDGWSEEGVGEWGAVGFGLVEGGGADAFGGDFEGVDFVGEAVGGERRRLIHQLEMEMRDEGVAGVADKAKDLAGFDSVALVNLDAAGLHVGVHRIAMLAQIEDDRVAVGCGGIDGGGILAGSSFGRAVGDGDNGGVGNGDRFFAENVVALHFFLRAAIDATLFVDLLPIDCVALREIEVAVDRKRGPLMANGIAAGIGGDVATAVERRGDDGDRAMIDGDGTAGEGDFLMIRRRGSSRGACLPSGNWKWMKSKACVLLARVADGSRVPMG